MRIRVYATSANLGPGFDSLGLCLSLYNEIEFEASSSSILIDPKFYGRIENNLIYKSYLEAFNYHGKDPLPVKLKVTSNIPPSRGLGSSSSCIVAGLLAGYLMMGKEINDEELLYLANKIEGHPDNVAPCIKGGLTASSFLADQLISINVPIKSTYKYLALIPDFELSTKEARKVLPQILSLEDAVFNSSSIGILISSLVTGRDDLIKYGFQDRIHQNYRGRLIPDFFKIMDFIGKTQALGSYLSGAGPTIMVLAKENDHETAELIRDYLKDLQVRWKLVELELNTKGYEILD